jgi:prophage maintenance system killer protein
MAGGSHGFTDGNKRTTLILLHTLITNSGYRLVPVGTRILNKRLRMFF